MVLESFAKQYLDQGLVIAPTACKLPKRRSHYLVINDRAGQREEVKAVTSWLTSLYQALT